MKDPIYSPMNEVAKTDMNSPSGSVGLSRTNSSEYISRHLRFGFKTDPFWRPSPIDPEAIIGEIHQFLKWFQNLNDQQLKKIKRAGIVTTFRDIYVFKMNTEEREGTQSLGETKFVARSSEKRNFSNLQQITFNIFRALDLTKELAQVAKEDENGTFLVTVQSINDWHVQLWENVKNQSGVRDVRPGEPRSEAFQKDSVVLRQVAGVGVAVGHSYPISVNVPDGFQMFVDRFNEIADSIRANSSADTTERLQETIKWSAWALFYCLSLHPYADGNGRTSRLLCNYILSSIFPFDVPVYNVHCNTTRKDYINALEAARQCPCSHPKNDGRSKCWTFSEVFENADPSPIATLVLESCWATCYAFWKMASQKIPDILSGFPLNWSLDSPGIILATGSLSLGDQSFEEEIDATEDEMDTAMVSETMMVNS